MKQYISSEGDTVDFIAWRVYGTQGAKVTEQLLEANPGLADVGTVLPSGVVINLPDIDTKPESGGLRLWD